MLNWLGVIGYGIICLGVALFLLMLGFLILYLIIGTFAAFLF